MKKYLWLVVLGILPFFIQAQKMTADEKADAEKNGQIIEEQEESDAVSFLYKVSRDDAQPFYIFGTIDLIGEEEFVFPENYQVIFQECEKLVLEFDTNDPELKNTFRSHLAAKDGKSLDKLLSQTDYQKASTFFNNKMETDLNRFKDFKPFYINSILSPLIIEGNTKSYELYLTTFAQELDKEIKSLETVEFQIKLFDEIPAKEQADMFMDVIHNLEKHQQIFADIVKFYKHNDPEVLYEYMIDNMPSYKKYKENLLDNRTQNWMDEINSLTQEGSCFFAVGAEHLGGEMGLLNLLKQDGYKLEAIE